MIPSKPWLPRAAPIGWSNNHLIGHFCNWMLPPTRSTGPMFRHYMTERFSHPATSFVQRQGMALYDHVDRSQICDHILRMRPCPSFFDAYQPCKMFHPEFILQNDILLWTPRTWPCHAYQRRRDLWNRCWNCEIPHCGQLHRQGWEHSEMFGFRARIASVEPRFWYSVYCLEPNFSGRLPLYTIDFQDLQTCLATQPFIMPSGTPTKTRDPTSP